MTKRNLTSSRVRELLHYNPETGIFTWLIHRNHKARIGDTAGSWTDYVRISIDNVDYLAQRLAWLYMTGSWPLQFVDHKDGNPFNNVWSNLRDVSCSINLQNQCREKLGVSWSNDRKLFVAQIKYAGKNRLIGRYPTFEQAKEAYLTEKRIHHLGAVRAW